MIGRAATGNLVAGLSAAAKIGVNYSLRRMCTGCWGQLESVTCNAFPGVAEKCFAAGAFACLTKPYKLENLMTLIDAGLKRATATQ